MKDQSIRILRGGSPFAMGSTAILLMVLQQGERLLVFWPLTIKEHEGSATLRRYAYLRQLYQIPQMHLAPRSQ